MWKELQNRLLKLIETSLDSLLLLLFLIKAMIACCIVVYGHIPIPSDWANKQLLNQSFDGFYIQADSFRINLWKGIELLDLEIRHTEMKDPILNASSTQIKLSFLKQGSFKPNITDLVVTDGTLMMPAVYSPDGRRTAILENVTFHLNPTENYLRIPSFIAKHQDIYLRGTLEWPITIKSQKKQRFSMDQIYQLLAPAIKEKARFSPFVEPTLNFALSTRFDNSLDVSLILSSKKLKHSEVKGSYFKLKTDLIFKDGEFIPRSPLLLAADKMTFPRFKVYAENITAQVDTDQWPSIINGNFPEFTISAHWLKTQHFELDTPEIKIKPSNFPELQFAGSTSIFEGNVKFSGKLDSEKKSGEVHASGNIDIFEVLPSSIQTQLPKLEFETSPFYDFSVILDEGLKPRDIHFYVETLDLNVNGIDFDHIITKGIYKKDHLRLSNVLISRNNQWAEGKFSLDTLGHNFDLSVIGSAIPQDYNTLLPRWWSRVFQDLNFDREKPPYGDFSIRGNLKGGTFFGEVEADNFSYNGSLIDKGQLVVWNYKNLVKLQDIQASAGSGRLTGNIGITSSGGPNNALLSVRYNLDGQLPVPTISQIIGGELVDILEEFELTGLPDIQADGVYFSEKSGKYANEDTVDIQAQITTPLKFKGTNLDYLNFNLFGHGENVFLRDVNFGYADGDGTAVIDILGIEREEPEMSFKANLVGANRSKAIEYFPSTEDDEETEKPTETDEEDLALCKGLLNMNVHARGPLGEIYRFDGYGDVVIRDEELGSIRLLGPLSQLLRNTPLNFSFFNLDRMDVIFEIDREQIIITKLEINGDRTKIWANGTVQLPDQKLDMDVKVSLFANSGDPDSAMNKFGQLIASPFPNLLSFKLGGTIEDQKVRSQFDPRNLIPGL